MCMQRVLSRHVGIAVLLGYALLCTYPSFSLAQEQVEQEQKSAQSSDLRYQVTPVVANEKAKPRDIIKKELLVTNNTGQRIDLYALVENIDPSQGAQTFVSPGVADLSTSLANWVEITRGVIELSAGESRKIPYLVHVNLTAKPGSYYARIAFVEGSRRIEAEARKAVEGTALLLTVEVLDDSKERLQLGAFKADDGIVFGDNVSFSYLLENVGNREVAPRGSIRIFNRKGEEVGSVPLNADGAGITPDNKQRLASAWSAVGRFGKYKAFLDLEYGENQLASVQDTAYFWVFPWKEILLSLAGIFGLGLVGTYIVHMRAVARPVHVRREESVGGEGAAPVMRRSEAVSVTPFPSNTVRSVHREYEHAPQGATVTVAPRSSPRPVSQGSTVRLSSRR